MTNWDILSGEIENISFSNILYHRLTSQCSWPGELHQFSNFHKRGFKKESQAAMIVNMCVEVIALIDFLIRACINIVTMPTTQFYPGIVPGELNQYDKAL